MRQSDQEMMILIIMAVVLLYANQKGILKPYLDKLKTLIGGAGVGGGAVTGSSTGSCTGGPYKALGGSVKTTQRGPTVRHYASGKPDDPTIEMNAKGIKFANYQFVNYITLDSIEHDDNVTIKTGGTHMGSGWYDHGISFEKGQPCGGAEKSHPDSECNDMGTPIGNIVKKKIGIAGTHWGNPGGGGYTELWADIGAGWKKLLGGNNILGFAPKSDEDEAQLRIDGAKVTIHCSTLTEIGPRATTAFARSRMTPDQAWLARANYMQTIPIPQRQPSYPLYARVALSSYKDECDECGTRRALQAQSGVSYEENWKAEHGNHKDCGEEIPSTYYWY